MFKPYIIRTALMAVLTVAGCVSQGQFLDNKQEMAVQTALTRARFEMQCPAATATVLSREVVQPAYQGPRVGGVQRASTRSACRAAANVQRVWSFVRMGGRVFCRRPWQTPRAVTVSGCRGSGI
jgi:hypothetical protein